MFGKYYHDAPADLTLAKKTFFISISSIFATVMLHPLDRIKARLQMLPDGKHTTISMSREIYKCEGFYGFYRGLASASLRQGINSTLRFFTFNLMHNYYVREFNRPPPRRQVFMYGVGAGLTGALLSNPAEVAMVRMHSSSNPRPWPKVDCLKMLRALKEPPYRSCYDAMRRMVREEGVKTLWRGGYLSIIRSVSMSTAYFQTYHQYKEWKRKNKDIYAVVGTEEWPYVAVNAFACIVSTIVTMPTDLIKTRYQRSRTWERKTQKSIVNRIIKENGVLSLWTGFTPYCLRMFFHTTFTMLMIDEVYSMYDSEMGGKGKF